jgi:hypothetical protein
MYRGVAASTGSAASDFAEQAQGANSLVRTYATLAANVYAASAAFSALSKASDISNLTKGLDMLGAASGKNLSGLSRKLVEITEGGLSLADSMKAVAKASSAGLSTENIERLGKVSKQSAQALGLDMGTAFDRLSRGVTKLEPELLDELGLFTKIGPATAEYARQMGKSASSLTDFEKRQAFANAVLDEGEKKFGAIALSSNGYNIILAKLTNLLQTVLEGINFVLKPIVDFLSASPTGLAIALGLLAKTVLGSLLPALKDWRSANKAAGESLKLQSLAMIEAKERAIAYRTESIAGTAAKKLENAEIRNGLALYKLSRDPSLSPKTGAALAASAAASTDDAALKALEKRRDELKKDLATPLGRVGVYPQKETELKALTERVDAYKALTIAKQQYNAAESFVGPQRPSKKLEIEENKLLAATQKNSIVQRGLEVQALDGTRAGFKAMWQEMQLARKGFDADGKKYEDGTKNLTRMGGAGVIASGGIKLVGSAIASAATAIQGALGWITLIIGVLGLFKDVLSTAKKEAAAFSEANDTLNSATKNVGATLDNIAKKKFIDAGTVEQVSNAFNDLSLAADKSVKAFDRLRAAPKSFLERLWDGALSLVGKSNKDDLANSLTDTVIGALALMEEGPAKKEFTKTLTNLMPTINIDSNKSISTEFKKLGESGISRVWQELTPAIQAANKEMQAEAGILTGLKLGFTETSKLVNDLNSSLKLTDAQGKLGTAMLEDSAKLAKALDKPKDALIALKLITDDFNLMALFTPETAQSLVDNKAEIDKISEALKLAKQESTGLSAQLSVELDKGTDADQTFVTALRAKLKAAEGRVTEAEGKSSLVSAKFSSISGELFVQAFKKIEISLKNAMQEAGIIAARGYLGIIKATGGSTAQQETALKVQELEVQRDVIKANYEQIKSAQSLRLSYEAGTAQQAVLSAAIALNTIALTGTKDQDATKSKATASLEDIQNRNFGDINKLSPKYASGERGKTLIAEERARLSIGEDEAIKNLQTKFNDIIALDIKTIEELSVPARNSLLLAVKAREVADKALEADKGGPKAMQKLAKDAKAPGASDLTRDAASAISATLIAGTAMQGQMAKISASISSVLLDGIINNEKEIADQLVKVQDNILTAKNAELDQIRSQQQYLGIFDKVLDAKQTALELEIQTAEKEKERIGFASIIKMIDLAQGKLVTDLGEEKAKQSAEYTALENSRSITKEARSAKEKARETEIGKVNTTTLVRRLTGEETLAAATRERATKTLEFENNIKQASIANLEAELNMRQALGTVSDKEMAIRTAEFSITKQGLDYTQQKLNLENTIATTTAKNLIDRAGLEKAGATKETLSLFDENAKKNLDILNLQGVSLAAQNASKIYAIGLSKEQQLQLAAEKKILEDQKYAMDNLVSSVNTLSIVFGDVGKKFGDGLTGVLQATQDSINARTTLDKKYAADKKDIETKTAAEIALIESVPESSIEDTLATKKKGEDAKLSLEKKFAKDSANLEFDKNAKVVSSAKNMFAQKTAAYKILDGVEKAMHTYRMLMNVKEVAMDLWKTGQEVLNSTVRTTAAVTEGTVAGGVAVLNQGKGDPYSAFFRMAAMAASVAVLIASIGGSFKGGGAAQTPTSEERQKLTGTGQKYSGNGMEIIDQGGGIPGDPTAKASSINKSLDILNKSTFRELEFSNKMLDAMQKVKTNTDGLGSLLGIAINRLANPNVKDTSGVQAGQIKGNASLGSLGTVAGTVGGGIAGMAAGVAIADAIMVTAASSAIGPALLIAMGPLGLIAGALLGSQLNKIIGSIFGGKTSNEITGFGIKVKASIGELAEGTKDLIYAYTAYTQTVKGGWFKSDRHTPMEAVSALGDPITALIQDTVLSLKSSLVSAGAALGEDPKVTESILKSFQVIMDIPLKGLTPEEGTKALEAEFSRQMNLMVTNGMGSLWDKFAEFAKPGEEAGAAIVRLARNTQTFDIVMKSLGNSTAAAATGVSKLAISEVMIDAAGGLENFTKQAQQFTSDFLTSGERLAPVYTALNDGFKAMGITGGMTGKEYKNLVRGLDLTTKAGRDLYQTLMNIEPAMKLIDEAENTAAKLQLELLELQGNKNEALAQTRLTELAALSDTDAAIKRQIYLTTDLNALNDAKAAQEQKILSLLGKTTEVTRLTREKELSNMDSNLRATQNYIYALEDEKTARDAATSAVSNTIKSLDGSIKTLKDYQFNLTTGAQGVMTPEQKYAALQQDLMATQAAAMGPTDTPAQLAAQQAAAAKLPTAAAAFLSSSQALYASTDKYTQDLAGVQGMITDTISSLTLSESLAQGQLDVLNSSNGFLATIDTSLISTNQLMYDFNRTALATSTALDNTFSNPLTMVPDATTALLNAEALQIQKDLLAATRITNELLAKKAADDKAIADALIITNATVVANQTEALVEAFTDEAGRIHYIGRTIGGSGDQKGNLYTNKP